MNALHFFLRGITADRKPAACCIVRRKVDGKWVEIRRFPRSARGLKPQTPGLIVTQAPC